MLTNNMARTIVGSEPAGRQLSTFPGSPAPHKQQPTRTPKAAAILKFIERELSSRSCGPEPSAVRLGIYREAFSRLSNSFGSYTSVLAAIRQEYEATLKQQHVDASELEYLRSRVTMFDQELSLTIAQLKKDQIKNTHDLREKLLQSTTKNRMLNREKLDLTTQIARLAQEVYDVNQLLVQEKAARQLAIGYMAKPKGKKGQGGGTAGSAAAGEGGDGAAPEAGGGGGGNDDAGGSGGGDGGDGSKGEALHAQIAELNASLNAAVKEATQYKEKATKAEQQYKLLMQDHSVLLSLQKKDKEAAADGKAAAGE